MRERRKRGSREREEVERERGVREREREGGGCNSCFYFPEIYREREGGNENRTACKNSTTNEKY